MNHSKNDSVGARRRESVYRRFNYPVFRIIGNELSGLNLMMFSASLGIIHQIRIVQSYFFDKSEIIPCQRHARTAVEGHGHKKVVISQIAEITTFLQIIKY